MNDQAINEIVCVIRGHAKQVKDRDQLLGMLFQANQVQAMAHHLLWQRRLSVLNALTDDALAAVAYGQIDLAKVLDGIIAEQKRAEGITA